MSAPQSPSTYIPFSDPALQVFEPTVVTPTVILPPDEFGRANVTVVQQDQRVNNKYTVTTNVPGGNVGEVQLNAGSTFAGSTGLTFDTGTSSLSVSGIVYGGEVWTDTLSYANGDPWSSGTGTSGYSGYSGYNGSALQAIVSKGIVSQYFPDFGGESMLQVDAAVATVFEYDVDASFDLTNVLNRVPGTTVILLLTQVTTGGWVMSTPGLSIVFAGGESTLSTAAGTLDQLTLFYTGFPIRCHSD